MIDYYGWNLSLRAMFETIGNYDKREYAIKTNGNVLRWLYLPTNAWGISRNLYFRYAPPEAFYYSTSILDWTKSNARYQLWAAALLDTKTRNTIKTKCNAGYYDMMVGTDCAIDIDSHDKKLSIQENVDRASILAQEVVAELDRRGLAYLLYYSGRGFSIRLAWCDDMNLIGSPTEVRESMYTWVDKLSKLPKVVDASTSSGASIDNIMNQDKRYTKVPWSMIDYGNIQTYAKPIRGEELNGFKMPALKLIRSEYKGFINFAANGNTLYKELKHIG